MKRIAPWIAAVLSIMVIGASAAAAQPAGKAKKGKGKKPAVTEPAPSALPPDPYGFGDVSSTAKPGAAPVDPYASAPKPAAGSAPVDPYASAPKPSGGAPVDPYASAPKPSAGGAPVDPYASASKPAGTAPVDPYATAPKPAPVTAPVDPYATVPKPAPVTAPVDPYASAPKPAPAGGAPADPYASPTPPPSTLPTVAPITDGSEATASTSGRLDIAAIQGLLAVQSFDGWLLADVAGQNTVAHTLVAPVGAPTRRWFYLVPRTGEPTLLCHVAEAASFAALPGRHLTYAGYRDLDAAVKALLKGKKTIAMEYSPKGALPSLSRVDAGTLELVRAAKVTVKSSDVLVQFVKATWGPGGRRTHYVAVHHLVELRKDALAFIRDRLTRGASVTELEVQQRIAKGMALRALIGPPPVVAFGKHTADPDYVPTADRSATLQRGDVIILALAGKVEGGVYAAQSWIAVADRVASIELMSTFDAVVQAREAALAFIRDRLKRRRAVQGWEVDHAARALFVKGGLDGHAIHRTGHSLDTDLQGSGTDLDDLEVKDQRALVVGTGFTVGPGLYYDGELGVRTEISVYLGKDGLEVTTPAQDRVELLLGP